MGLFSSPKKPSLPAVPTFYSDPYVGLSESTLYNRGSELLSPTVEGLPPILREAVSLNPDITRMMLAGLEADLAPSHRQGQQDIISQLEANNQLTGSTTASALGNFENDYQSQLTSAGASAGINDISRALAARLSLYSTGLNSVQASGNMGLSNQSQHNEFNLANYENEVAKTLAEQKSSSGGLLGALTGGLGGAMAGSMFGPLGTIAGGLIGGVSGAVGPSGTGGGFLTAGAQSKGLQPYLSGLTGPNSIIPSSGTAPIVGNGEQIQDVLKGSPLSASQYINKWYGGLS